MTPSRRYNSVSADLFRMKLTENIEKKLGKIMKALFDGFAQITRLKRLFLAQLEKVIVIKQHFSKKE